MELSAQSLGLISCNYFLKNKEKNIEKMQKKFAV
jgi:hypothetical protein